MVHVRERAAAALAAGAAVFALLAGAPADTRDTPTDRTQQHTTEPEDLDELARGLHEDRPDARRRAVKKLADLGGREAFELVIRTLDDDEPEVADEAQFGLAGIEDERLLRALLDREGLRARDPWRRLRVAEAFGRMRVPIDASALLRAVARVDPEVSASVLWSAERLARDGLLAGKSERIARELASACARPMPERIAASALCALAAFDRDAALAELRHAFDDPRELVRCAALSLGDLLPDDEAVAAARSLGRDDSESVRSQSIEALGRIGTRSALQALCDRLAPEPRLRLRWRAVELLQDLSGMKYRLDPRPWALWISKLPDDWRPVRGGATTESGSGTVAFAGLPILSDRVAFLVDFSGSLWHEREAGGTRKEVVDQRLREVLPSLPEGTRFNVVPYTADPHPWMDRLVDVSEPNVRAALRFFDRCDEHGKGNFYDAALLALQDPEVDTIVVLTDGVPTGGHRWKLELMMPLLVHETRFRRVAFDSIVVDAPPRVRRHWSWLAAQTGGRSIAIEM